MNTTKRLLISIICLALGIMCFSLCEAETSEADSAEFAGRKLPSWYQDAKLGIFIHWGIYSVPAFAVGEATLADVLKTLDFEGWFANMPYAAWYLNSMKIESSPTYKHHLETYGADFPYENFTAQFNESIQKWDPASWASLFKVAGARYVVLTTKHHDGFLLWSAETSNPFRENYYASRDIVGELTEAARTQGLRMGLYYSSGLDWTFKAEPIRDLMSSFSAVPQQQEYVDYINAHWRELIDRYHPGILWADIGSPNTFDAVSLLKYYYATVPDGLVNDRHKSKVTFQGIVPAVHHDFTTPEYMSKPDITEKKWESTRGIGKAFAYNKMEDTTNYLSVDELVDSFVDIVSKNGNLLLGVGPRADGTIPEEQKERLLGLGAWLKINGEAIFGSHYWDRAEGTTSDGIPIRFTQNKSNLYAILLERPKETNVIIEEPKLGSNLGIQLLGTDSELIWEQKGEHLSIQMPEDYPESEAYVLRIVLAK